MRSLPRAVLFDLDGTLIDSAPDLAGAANDLRSSAGLPRMPLSSLRPHVGAGARGMVGAALGLAPGQPGYEAARDAFLERYAGRLLDETLLFPAMQAVLEAIEARGISWGIVTNKFERYAHPIVEGLGLGARSSVLICGDTTPHAKPHPAPLFEAARRLQLDAADCVYVGDDLRDMQAGRAAGMRTVAAGWGYLGEDAVLNDWGADFIADEPALLLKWLALD